MRAAGGTTDSHLRQRLARLHTIEEILRLIRLRTVSAKIRGEQPGPEASIRKVLADEHGQAVMKLAKDLAGSGALLTDVGPLGADVDTWHYGYLFSRALTIGGGTGEVQRNILAERVLGLPHDTDVEAGKTWAEARRGWGRRTSVRVDRAGLHGGEPRRPTATRWSSAASRVSTRTAAYCSMGTIGTLVPATMARNSSW